MSFSVRIAVILVASLVIGDLHSVIWKIWPQTEFITYDLFWSKNFHLKLNVLWYIYELGNLLNKMIWSYVVASVGLRISAKIFWIGIIFLGYWFTQFFFYMWDRNTSFVSNVVVYCFILAEIAMIFIPEKRLAKIISMEK